MRGGMPSHGGRIFVAAQAQVFAGLGAYLAVCIVASGAVETVLAADLMWMSDRFEFSHMVMAFVADMRSNRSQVIRRALE